LGTYLRGCLLSRKPGFEIPFAKPKGNFGRHLHFDGGAFDRHTFGFLDHFTGE
jgi:hypothetical protein